MLLCRAAMSGERASGPSLSFLGEPTDAEDRRTYHAREVMMSLNPLDSVGQGVAELCSESLDGPLSGKRARNVPHSETALKLKKGDEFC